MDTVCVGIFFPLASVWLQPPSLGTRSKKAWLATSIGIGQPKTKQTIMAYFQMYFRCCPPGSRIHLSWAGRQRLLLRDPDQKLLDQLDQKLRIVRGLDDCISDLVIVQVELLIPEGSHSREYLRHGQITQKALDQLLKSNHHSLETL